MVVQKVTEVLDVVIFHKNCSLICSESTLTKNGQQKDQKENLEY